jgi:hypothetical protein
MEPISQEGNQTEVSENTNLGLDAFLSRLEMPRPEDANILKVNLFKGEGDPAAYASYKEASDRRNNETLSRNLPMVIEGISEQFQINADRLSATGDERDAFSAKQYQDVLKLLKFRPLTQGGSFGDREERLFLALIQFLTDSEAPLSNDILSRLEIQYIGEEYDKKPANEEEARKLEKFHEFDWAKLEVHQAIKQKYEFLTPRDGLMWWARKVDPEYYEKRGEKEILRME